MTSWSMRVDELTDIYSETRLVDLLRTVDSVAVDRVNAHDGSVHVAIEVPKRSIARLVREMIRIIDPNAIVSMVRPHVRATF